MSPNLAALTQYALPFADGDVSTELHSTLLHLLPLRSIVLGIDHRTVAAFLHWKSGALTARLNLNPIG